MGGDDGRGEGKKKGRVVMRPFALYQARMFLYGTRTIRMRVDFAWLPPPYPGCMPERSAGRKRNLPPAG